MSKAYNSPTVSVASSYQTATIRLTPTTTGRYINFVGPTMFHQPLSPISTS